MPGAGERIRGKRRPAYSASRHFLPQHFLYFFPLPHGQGSFGYTFLLPGTIFPETPLGMTIAGISSALESRSRPKPIEVSSSADSLSMSAASVLIGTMVGSFPSGYSGILPACSSGVRPRCVSILV